MAPFYGWGSTASRLEPLQGASLLFTTNFPEIPGIHFIDLGRMRLSWPWVHPVVLNMGPRVWKSSDLTTRPSLHIRTTIECRFTLKRICGMIITYCQMHHTDKYFQHRSIIWPVWLNGWVFSKEPSGCGFESRCCDLNFIYCPCFEQGVPLYRV